MRHTPLLFATAMIALASCATDDTVSKQPRVVDVSATNIDVLTGYEETHGKTIEAALESAAKRCVLPDFAGTADVHVASGRDVASGASGVIPYLLTMTFLQPGASMQNFTMSELLYQANFNFAWNSTVVTEVAPSSTPGVEAAQDLTRLVAQQIDRGRLTDLSVCPK